MAAPRLRVVVPGWLNSARIAATVPVRDVPGAAMAHPSIDHSDERVSAPHGANDRLEASRVVVPIGDPPVSGPANRSRPTRRIVDAPPDGVVAPGPGIRAGGVDLALGVYLAIALWLGTRLIVSIAAIGRLRRDGEPVGDPVWAEALDRWQSRLGVARPVAMLETDRVSIPVVVGWICPAIVVPRGLAGTMSPAAIDAVLLHELGHVRRGDFGWNLLRTLVHIVYWPHPLIWMLAGSSGRSANRRATISASTDLAARSLIARRCSRSPAG